MANDQKFLIDEIKKKVIVNRKLFNSPHFVETNSSVIILAGDKALKILKEGKGEIDCSTFLSRGTLLREEMQINSEISPGLYFDVMSVSLHQGKIVIGSEDSVTIEYALCMKRLRQDSLIYNMLLSGAYSEGCSVLIAKKIADFHISKLLCRSDRNDQNLVKDFGTIKTFCEVVKKDFEIFEELRPNFALVVITEQRYQKIKKYILKFLKKEKCLLVERVKSGYVFPIHGDFHSQNIFIEDGIVYAIDRSLKRKMRVGDVIKDLAYLAIDLEMLGFNEQKEIFFREYHSKLKDDYFKQLLPFYMCRYSFVAGMVNLFKKDFKRSKAYFDIAYNYAIKDDLCFM